MPKGTEYEQKDWGNVTMRNTVQNTQNKKRAPTRTLPPASKSTKRPGSLVKRPTSPTPMRSKSSSRKSTSRTSTEPPTTSSATPTSTKKSTSTTGPSGLDKPTRPRQSSSRPERRPSFLSQPDSLPQHKVLDQWPSQTLQNRLMRLHLEKIQHTIANQLCIGALFPERRRQCAEKVVDLKNEADYIAQNPDQFRILEAWKSANPTTAQYKSNSRSTACSGWCPKTIYSANASLTTGPIHYRKPPRRQANPPGKKQCAQMRKDAEIMRRSKPVQVDGETEYHNQNPDQLVIRHPEKACPDRRTTIQVTQKRLVPAVAKGMHTRHAAHKPTSNMAPSGIQPRNGLDPPNRHDSQPLKAIKFRLNEEFQNLDTQTAQLEQAENLSN